MKCSLFILLTVFVTRSMAQDYSQKIGPANNGDADAQWWIGNFYEEGYGGVERNDSAAFAWYKKSADQGYAKSQAKLAFFHENGIATSQDDWAAFTLYKNAADQGLPSAQISVGQCYELGKGVTLNLLKARDWYKRAIDNGSEQAKTDLARVEIKIKEIYPPEPKPDTIVPPPATPLIRISDNYELSGIGKTLQKKETFDLTIALENNGDADADSVLIKMSFPKNVFLIGGKDSILYNNMIKHDKKKLTFSFVISDSYTESTIPVVFKVHERFGKYAENWQTDLTIGQDLGRISKRESDIDIDIPQNKQNLTSTYAFIVSEENYRNVEPVPYATNDGKIFKEYCTKTLGIPEANIIFLEDPTKTEFDLFLKNLKERAKRDKNPHNVKVVVYYAGHGVPDEKRHAAHLLLSDSFGNYAESGISLQHLYQELGEINASCVTVFLDACFSGQKRDGGMIFASRGVVIPSDDTDPVENMVVFAAAQNNESAYSYAEKQHGTFTYFLLKKLKETSGNVTFGELSQYLEDEVTRTSSENNREQTPSVSSKALGWESWKLR